jgi:predicted membrane-bound spermidine synthase
MQALFKSRFFYALSFIEGGAVMAAELMGAKMMAPYFGSSLYVWASVLAVTLGGLAFGYFAGGVLSQKSKNPLSLFWVLLLAAIFVLLMPFISKTAFMVVGEKALLPSIIFSSVVFLLPPVFFMGMVSPLIISNIANDINQVGRASGNVYAISTLGGITATFLTGFYIIPHFGLTIPCIFTGIILGIIPATIIAKKYFFGTTLFFLITAWSFYKALTYDMQPGIKIPYMSEGLLGQVMVADYPNFNIDGTTAEGTNRILFVNRITQAQINDRVDSMKHFNYVDFIMRACTYLPDESKTLVCGLGGGSLPNQLIKNGYSVDVCELDERIYDVAKKYFSLNPNVNVTIDDARHFIRTHRQNKYNLIVLDMFKGEENPSHCFTTEALAELKTMLASTGLLVINGNGFINGEKGKGTRSIIATLKNAGFNVMVSPTDEDEAYRNLEIWATPNHLVKYLLPRDIELLNPDDYNLADATIFTDDKPQMDKLNLAAYVEWRKNSINYFVNEMQRGRNFPVFK